LNMSRHLQPKSLPIVSLDSLSETAMEALRNKRFKDAIELLKRLVREDSRSEWRDALSDAYVGRAKALAAKGMLKEAEIVLRNTVASDGTVKDPLFLVQCLIRQGQFQKALSHALKYIGTGETGTIEVAELDQLTAALYLVDPNGAEHAAPGHAARERWIEVANVARTVLNTWIEGRSEEEIDPLLGRIPMRSPFYPLRLIVKSLFAASYDCDRARRLLDRVPMRSPFASLRLAIEATLPAEPMEHLAKWDRASVAQQSFAIEVHSERAESSRLLSRLLEAENSGSAALFSFLLKQSTRLPEREVRRACLDLLPRLPDRIAQFEKAFGPLMESEKNRILALSAEASQQWSRAEKHWRAMALDFEKDGSREARLSAGVIYRHLADLACSYRGIAGEGFHSDAQAFYLKASIVADPDCLAALLRLIHLYRDAGEDKKWHEIAEEAAWRFPEESAVLLQAIDAATARRAYKKAAGLAQKLVRLDPINQPARQRMIDLQIAHARKQMQAQRPDLAWKELADAAQWERADSPDAGLRVNQGLVGLHLERGPDADRLLREGVALAGGGIPGWFRAALEGSRLLPVGRPHMAIVIEELARATRCEPEKQQIALLVSAISAGNVRANTKAIRKLIFMIRPWLQKASALDLLAAEFHALGDIFLRTGSYDLLADFARAGKRRSTEEPAWRFYEIVARTQNNPDRLDFREESELSTMQHTAQKSQDYHWFNRIQRYLESLGDDPAANRRARRPAASAELDDEAVDAMVGVLDILMNCVSPNDVRRLVKNLGRDRAIAALSAKLTASPISSIVPDAAIPDFAEAVIDGVIGNGGRLA
jgi:hypothetical protein